MMEHDVQPFKAFMPGNHLVLGAAGVGKTRLIWSLLQSKEFCQDNTVNIVLTDHSKPLWHGPNDTPIFHISPYANDLNWIANPQKPGIYYAACDYLPRMHTFLECLANYSRNIDQMKAPVRVFLDFPNKYWLNDFFMEQIGRLLYISESCDFEAPELEVWTTMSIGRDIPYPNLKGYQGHKLLLNPLNESMLESANQLMNTSLAMNDFGARPVKDDGFYYLPSSEKKIYYKIA